MNRESFKTIVYGGLSVGILDGLAAIISSAIAGVSPDRIFKYITSALLGRAAYDYGFETILLGVFLHFLIAFSAATIYYVASRKISFLVQHPFLSGAIYGVIVYFVMQGIVKLSLAAPIPFSVSGLIRGILIHIFCVGLPIALITSRLANRKL